MKRGTSMTSSFFKLVALWSFMLLILGSDASFTLQGEMVNYTNPFHSTANGECCHVHPDVARPPNCNQQCDNVFVFCWKAYGSTSTSIAEKACISRISTSIIASSDNFTFPIGNLLSANVPPPRNPLILKGATWRGSIQLFVRVVNDDNAMKVLVDHFRMNAALIPGTSTPTKAYPGINENATITAHFTLSCDRDYYGLDCTTHCTPQDSAEFGHYTCGPSGEKLCRVGYVEPAANCTQCGAPAGCSPVNGYCNNSNECLCHAGYGGPTCNEDLDVCGHLSPCTNGGMCTNRGPDLYHCSCLEGYSGTNCENDDDTCAHTAPCRNNATCANTGPNTYKCLCTDKFTGDHCNIYYKTNICDSTLCHNGGTCVSTGPSTYQCHCPQGYGGYNCSDDLDVCRHIAPCQNGATCNSSRANTFICQCTNAYTGIRCDVPIELDICKNAPCQNGGTCITRGLLEYVCVCAKAFGGMHCEDNFDLCTHSLPCKNNGTCLNAGANAYECFCPMGYSGDNCQLRNGNNYTSGNSNAIIGGCLVALILVVILVIIGLVFACYRRSKGKLFQIRKKSPTESMTIVRTPTSELTNSDVFIAPGDHRLLVKAPSTATNSSTQDLEHIFSNPLYKEGEHFYTCPEPQEHIATLHYYSNSNKSVQVNHYHNAERTQDKNEAMYYSNHDNIPATREPFYNTAFNKQPLYYGDPSTSSVKNFRNSGQEQQEQRHEDSEYSHPVDGLPFYSQANGCARASFGQSGSYCRDNLRGSATYHVLEHNKPTTSHDPEYHVLESSVKQIIPTQANNSTQQYKRQNTGKLEHDYSVLDGDHTALQKDDIIYEEADSPVAPQSRHYLSNIPPDYDSIDYAAVQEIYATPDS